MMFRPRHLTLCLIAINLPMLAYAQSANETDDVTLEKLKVVIKKTDDQQSSYR